MFAASVFSNFIDSSLGRETWLILIVALILLVIIIVIAVKKSNDPVKKAYTDIRHGKVSSIDDFLSKWNNDKSDYPGCYIILAYKRRIVHNYLRYNEVYVGQSVNVRKRVHSHLSGRGNGEVYHLLRSEYHIYVYTIKCKEKKLNEVERDLIAKLCATDSINITTGGAATRK